MGYLKKLLSGMLLLTAMTVSCTTVSKPEAGLNTSSNQEIIQTRAVDTSFPNVKRIIASDYLIGYISVVNPRLGETGNFPKAQVTVQNLTQNRYDLEYQFQWEDQGGFPAGSPRPWKRFILGPKEAISFSEMALRQDAKKTTFTVRIVDDTFIETNKLLND